MKEKLFRREGERVMIKNLQEQKIYEKFRKNQENKKIIGVCDKCRINPTKHHSNICSSCRTNQCTRCHQNYTTSSNMICSKCRQKKCKVCDRITSRKSGYCSICKFLHVKYKIYSYINLNQDNNSICFICNKILKGCNCYSNCKSEDPIQFYLCSDCYHNDKMTLLEPNEMSPDGEYSPQQQLLFMYN